MYVLCSPSQIVPSEGQENGQKEKEEDEDEKQTEGEKEKPKNQRRESLSEVSMETQEEDTKKGNL